MPWGSQRPFSAWQAATLGGAHVVNNGQKIVRPVVMGVLALLFVKILAG